MTRLIDKIVVLYCQWEFFVLLIVIERRDSLIKEYDSLTGLYNFSTFLMETRHMLDANPDTEYAMLVLDIERFKVIL